MMTHDYERHGTRTLSAALDVATGKVIGEYMPRHRRCALGSASSYGVDRNQPSRFA
jgi:hypothetical protein